MTKALGFLRNLSLTWRFGLAAMAVIALLGVALSQLLSQTIIRNALEDAQSDTRDTVAPRMVGYLRPADLTTPLSSQRIAELNRFIKDTIVSPRTARIKIWSLDGRVVYADDPGIIGQVFEPDDERLKAMEGKTASELSHLEASENISEVGYSALLEVYTPIIFPGSQKVAGVFEIYQVFDPIAQRIAEMQRFVTLALSGSLAILYLALLGIVHGGTRTIGRQQRSLTQALTELQVLNLQLEQRVLERTAELGAATERYQTLYEDNPTMYFTVDGGGKVLSVNLFGAEQLGYAPEELQGQSVLVLIAPEDRPVALNQIEECVRNPGQVLQWIGRRVRKDGSLLWAREVARAVVDPGGGVVFIVSSDITEQTQAAETSTRLVAILEATTDHVSTTNLNGNVLYLNRSGRSMLGIGESESISKLSILDVFSDKARSLLSSHAIPTAIRNGAWSGEVALLHSNGKEIPVSLVTVAHRSHSGPVEFLSYIARDITERKNLEDRLVHLATHDPLTGLFNRRRFEEELEIQLAQAGRYATQGAIAFFDLDHFKTVNDSLGHHAGDELLASVAQLLRGRLRSSDILARLGGDEFAIFMPRADAHEARIVAQRILDTIGETNVTIEGRLTDISASIGIALVPEHGTTKDELLAHADLAMYQAKDNGRAQFSIYDPQIETRLAREQWIRDALEKERFVLYGQAIYDLHSNGVSHYEVLVRMIDDDDTVIPPSEFLPVAERFSRIHSTDRWVVRRAIRLMAQQKEKGREVCLEINLSGRAFGDPELLTIIQQEITGAGINPNNLIFEWPESATTADLDEALQFISAIKNMGCRFALDDFGIGFSSFYYLKRLPVDLVKIDGSFIRNLPQDITDQHLVRAMVEVARGLGKDTIAEFVGDMETVELLKVYGVSYAQGYFLGLPMPLSELLET